MKLNILLIHLKTNKYFIKRNKYFLLTSAREQRNWGPRLKSSPHKNFLLKNVRSTTQFPLFLHYFSIWNRHVFGIYAGYRAIVVPPQYFTTYALPMVHSRYGLF